MFAVKVASKPTRTVITSFMHLAVVNAVISTEFDFKVDGYNQTIVWAKPC